MKTLALNKFSDTSDGTGSAMTMMLSSIFVVLFMIIH